MVSDSTRWTVIQRAAAGSAEHRDEFARRYSPVIHAYLQARWRGTPLSGEVEDAAQQVFVDCFKENGALGRVDPEHGSGFRAFLYGVVRNVARGMERSRARRKEHQPDSNFDLDAQASKEESLAGIFDRAWASTILRDAARLQLERARAKGPEAVRRHRLLGLRFAESLRVRDIAARWDVDVQVLYREMPKARSEFRAALMEVVRELHGGRPEAVERECERLRRHFG